MSNQVVQCLVYNLHGICLQGLTTFNNIIFSSRNKVIILKWSSKGFPLFGIWCIFHQYLRSIYNSPEAGCLFYEEMPVQSEQLKLIEYVICLHSFGICRGTNLMICNNSEQLINADHS